MWFVYRIFCEYRQVSNIKHTESQNLNVSRLGLQLSLRNVLKPGVKPRMKMSALLQLHLSDQQFNCLLECVLYSRLDGISLSVGQSHDCPSGKWCIEYVECWLCRTYIHTYIQNIYRRHFDLLNKCNHMDQSLSAPVDRIRISVSGYHWLICRQGILYAMLFKTY